MKNLRTWITTGLVLLVIGQLALRAGPPDGKAPPPREPREQGGADPQTILNREQRAILREYMEENGKELRSFGDKFQRARQEFKEALLADKPDEEEIKKKAAAIAELHTKRLMMQADALSQIRPTLTPEQLERLRNSELLFEFGARGEGPRGFRGPPPPEQDFRPPPPGNRPGEFRPRPGPDGFRGADRPRFNRPPPPGNPEFQNRIQPGFREPPPRAKDF